MISRQAEARAEQQNKSQLLDDRDDKQWIMQDFAVYHTMRRMVKKSSITTTTRKEN